MSQWSDQVQSLHSVNYELARTLNDIVDSSKSLGHPIIKAEFSYGDMILESGQLSFPDWIKSDNIGFGLVLNHSLEMFTSDETGSSPVAVLDPGQTFVLMDNPDLSLMPLTLLNITAGARSIFLLPKITETTSFFRLAKAYNLKDKEPPISLAEHWKIFTEIAKNSNSSWKATVLFFDKSWLNCDSLAGSRLYQYLRQANLPSINFFRKKLAFEKAFAETLNELNFKPDSDLIQHIKRLFEISCHFVPGYVFAECENLAPISLLQEAFVNHYGLNYVPSILKPGYAKEGRPCYYSMQHPMLLNSLNEARKHDTSLEQMREIYRVVYKTIKHIETIHPISNELLEFIHAELEFFHTAAKKKHHEVLSSKYIKMMDPIVKKQISKFHSPFSDASTFLQRGCIAMSLD